METTVAGYIGIFIALHSDDYGTSWVSLCSDCKKVKLASNCRVSVLISGGPMVVHEVVPSGLILGWAGLTIDSILFFLL